MIQESLLIAPRRKAKVEIKLHSHDLKMEKKSFWLSVAFMFLVMIVAYILTMIVPGGVYSKIDDGSGNQVIDTSAGLTSVQGGIPFWKWLLSPILVLTSSGGRTLIPIILFLLLLGGIFSVLITQGILSHMLGKLVRRFAAVRYRLMATMILFFMALGAFIGSFEEVIPLVPIVVTLAVCLGWDIQTGVAISLLAVGCGFASGVANPFTVGVAHTLAGLPVFSGIWFRILCFAVIYVALLGFIILRARKAEKNNPVQIPDQEDQNNPRMDRAVRYFSILMGIGIVIIIVSGFFPVLSDYTLILLMLTFLGAGISSSLVSGMNLQELGKAFLKGIVDILPTIVLILMASSIRYIMEEGRILDTCLHLALESAGEMPRIAVILFIYLICMATNFFVPSGSAEALLLIPIIVPLAGAFRISAQLCIVAFSFGDGFSNILYPTNPALMVALGLANCGYGKWIRYSLPFQILILALTCGLLVLGLALGYA